MNPRILAFFVLFLINQTVLAFPTAKLTIKVIDESGNPIQGADAGINFETPKPIGKGAGINIKRKSGKTDSDGLFSAKGETTPQVSPGASQEDYYPSSSKFKQFTGVGGFVGFRKHEPRNPTVVLVLKKIINPIPMYAVNRGAPLPDELPEFPVIGRFIGYDLIANDWVAPHGKGIHNDFLFKVVIDRAISINDYDATLFMKFTNSGDGLIEYTPDISKGKSLLRFPHYAPVNGYTGELVQHYERTPGVSVTGTGGYPEYETNYYFRVRTEFDKDGNVTGGLYGKIHGKIKLSNFNPINRYSIGSATPSLKKAADGSITLYFSAKSPGKDKESNWLPAPEGPFWLVLRTYGPGKAILDKTWKVPPVKQLK